MIREEKIENKPAAKCKNCGRELLNPGYGGTSQMCCGKSRRWYNCEIIKTTVDDGRDEKGRFHHRPRTISTKWFTLSLGG